MILVDTSIWIDRIAHRTTIQTLAFAELLRTRKPIALGDLVVTEILQGARDARHADELLEQLDEFAQITIVNRSVAVEAARNYRTLRARGITIRKTIDTLIATRCILDGIPLLYSDRDFDPFVEHLGLTSALDSDPGVN